MTWSIGLNLGESVLEITAKRSKPDSTIMKRREHNKHAAKSNDDTQLIHSRTFSPASSFSSTISQFLKQNEITKINEVRIVTNLVTKIIEARHGSPAVMLTTIGFENWLDLNLPLEKDYFTFNPKKIGLPIAKELIFSISERTNAEGAIEKIVSEEDLEFFVTKLELHNIKNVAICYLHSTKNPENEKRTAHYLTSRGFNVFKSSDNIKSKNEISRFWNTLLAAYATPYFIELLSPIYSIFQPLLSESAQIKIGNQDLKELIECKTSCMATAFSLTDFISNNFAKSTDLIYCGMEDFYFFERSAPDINAWQSPFGEVYTESKKFSTLFPQPLTELGKGFFAELCFTQNKVSYDSGPMIFGRSLKPTFFDLLNYNESFENVLGLNSKINERGQKRFFETIFALSKINQSKTNRDFDEIRKTLLLIAKEQLLSGCNNITSLEEVTLCGPLAPQLRKIIGDKVVGGDFFVTNSLLLSNANESFL
ncbi:MAG: hydantoinase/oxoprolinase N-terminal domain-containing protein [Bdellovibrionales bacterium]